MKKLFVLSMLLWGGMTLYGQSCPKKMQIPFDFLEGCEMGTAPCDPVNIVRADEHENWFLVFPSGGTQSDVFLHSVGANGEIWKCQGKAAEPVRHDGSGSEGNPVISLAGVPDGNYHVSMLSCGLGGSFALNLSTQKPGTNRTDPQK